MLSDNTKKFLSEVKIDATKEQAELNSDKCLSFID